MEDLEHFDTSGLSKFFASKGWKKAQTSSSSRISLSTLALLLILRMYS